LNGALWFAGRFDQMEFVFEGWKNAVQLGVGEVLAKPFHSPDFVDRIHNLCGRLVNGTLIDQIDHIASKTLPDRGPVYTGKGMILEEGAQPLFDSLGRGDRGHQLCNGFPVSSYQRSPRGNMELKGGKRCH
jgi:hypothetical protein